MDLLGAHACLLVPGEVGPIRLGSRHFNLLLINMELPACMNKREEITFSTVAQKYKSIHSTAILLHSTTPNSSTLLSHSFTPLQNSFTRRPRFIHSTALIIHFTPLILSQLVAIIIGPFFDLDPDNLNRILEF